MSNINVRPPPKQKQEASSNPPQSFSDQLLWTSRSVNSEHATRFFISTHIQRLRFGAAFLAAACTGTSTLVAGSVGRWSGMAMGAGV
jgi:uncharacterized membrane protein YagU involved in acid resistance